MAMQSTDEAELGPNFGDLPADFVTLLYEALPLKDFVSASCTCQHWRRCGDRVWEGKCRARWQYWSNPPPASSSSSSSSSDTTGFWRDLYRQRHQLDNEVLTLLQSAAWPDQQSAAYSSIMQMGDDALDVLAAAAHSSSGGNGLTCGLAYRATVALHYVRGGACAEQLQQLLVGQQQQQPPQQEPGGSSAPAATTAATAAGGSCSSSLRDADVMLEGVLLLAQALHPLTDVAGVRRLISGMAQELQRRMQQTHAARDSRQSVDLLNQLMFGPPPAAAAAAAGSAAPDAATSTPQPAQHLHDSSGDGSTTSAKARGSDRSNCSSSSSSSGGSSKGSNGLRCSWWQRNADLDGPELSRLDVPRDGCSGMGFKGNTSDYYNPLNSCLDSVLATRQGLPISLAVLYAAVAAAAGLTVQLVNMPGHIICRARLRPAAAAAAVHAEEAVDGSSHDSSGSGDDGGGDGGTWMYVDVFDGGRELDEAGIRSIQLHYAHGIPSSALTAVLQPLSPTNTIKRMLNNLVNTFRQAHGSRAATAQLRGNQPDPPPLQLQLQSISVVLLSCGIIPLVYEARREFDLFVQLAHLVGMGPLEGPPGALLLMRKLAASLPPALRLWQLKMEAGANEIARRQQLQPSQVKRRSEHPAVQYCVGDYVRYQRVPRLQQGAGGGNPMTGFIVGWSVARSSGALAEAEAAADAYGEGEVTGRQVLYQLVADGSVLGSCNQREISCLPGSSRPTDEQERTAWAASCSQQQQWHQQHLKDSWFEWELVVSNEDEQKQEQQFSLGGWPEHHLQLGEFFDAAWEVDVGGMGLGGCVLNPYYRSKYPEG